MNAAICYFAYRRPEKLAITLEALLNCEGIERTPIVIVEDVSAKLEKDPEQLAVNAYIKKFIARNPGLNIEHIRWKNHAGPLISLTRGFMYALNKYGAALRVEDDIEVRPDYLRYMNSALEFYRDDPHIFGICPFTWERNLAFEFEHDIVLMRDCSMWGLGTWRDRYEKVFSFIWNTDEDVLNEKSIQYSKVVLCSSKVPEHVRRNDYHILEHCMGTYPSFDFVEDTLTSAYVWDKHYYCVFSRTNYVKYHGFDNSGTDRDFYYLWRRHLKKNSVNHPFHMSEKRFQFPFSDDFGYHYAGEL